MSKKDDSKLDLDFSEIGEKTPKQESKKSNKPKIKNKKLKTKLGDIVLSIPSEGDSQSFISKTIASCTSTEFVKWAKKVAYPLDPNPEYFSEEENRVSQFLKILTFHKKNFTVSNPNAAQTLH